MLMRLRRARLVIPVIPLFQRFRLLRIDYRECPGVVLASFDVQLHKLFL